MYEGRERRRYRRVRAEVQVDIERYESEPMLLSESDAASKNVSGAGLLVVFKDPVPVPSTVLARFSLPGEEDKLEVVARTIRCIEVEGGYGVGLEFIDATPEEIERIERYARDESSEDSTA
jgi:c-di-GMP-binding flagellar brake protein YcgR